MKALLTKRGLTLLAGLLPLLTLSIGISGFAFAHTGLSVLHAASYNLRTAAPSDTAVLTYKNDNQHSGQNPHETILTPNNVKAPLFGRHVSYPVDGQVYAQPLYMPGLTINQNTYNVVFVATENDTLYAFDADQIGVATAPLWKKSFLGSGESAVSSTTIGCGDLTPSIGISGTPVIDPATNTLYAVGFTNSGGSLIYRLHAIDVLTGAEKPGSPTTINNISNFSNNRERQRPNLLLANGQIYIGFASFCDLATYHGFILSYSYNGSSFTRTHVYDDTPNGIQGGIWGGAGTLTADGNGNIYVTTGNGTFDLNSGGHDASDSFLKLSSSLALLDYFTPFNQSCLSAADADLGSGGDLILSGSGYTELIGGGKEGRIYVLDANKLGHFNSISNPCGNQSGSNDPNAKQELPQHYVGGIFSTPSTWTSATNQYVYVGGVGDHVKAFKVNSDGTLVRPPASQTPETLGFAGGNTFISSNGNANGILWVNDSTGVLRAYDATNLSTELFHATLSGSYVKFSTPAVANGDVFVGTKSTLDIFGLEPTSPQGYNNVGISDDSNPSGASFDGGCCSYSFQALQAAGVTPGGTVTFNGVNFTWPNVPAGQLDNYVAQGQTIAVPAGSNENTVAFLGAANNGNASGQGIITFTDTSTQSFTLNLSDWTLGGNTNPVAFGNGIAVTTPYRNTQTTKQTRKTYVFYTQVALASTNVGKTVQSVILPSTTSGGTLHVFAVSAVNLNSPPPPPPTNYNNTGISNDGSSSTANFDGGGYSYSFQALSPFVTPNSQFAFGGYTFTWPNAAAGSPDNYQANGQTIPCSLNSGTHLGFLGSATHGPASVMVTVTYADNSTQTFTLTFSDWTLNAGASSPVAGNQKAITTLYRNGPTGKQTKNTYVFFTEVALTNTSSVVKSITLSSPSTGALHVFTFSTR